MSRIMVVGVAHPGEPVIGAACWLAERLHLEPVLAHAVEDPAPFPYGDGVRREQERHRRIDDARELLASAGVAGDVAREVLLGAAAPALEALAARLDATCVAVGSRRRGTVRSTLMGSVSRELAARADRPVLVVPPDSPGPPPDLVTRPPVVCGTDGSPDGEAALRAAADVAEAAGLPLVLVNAQHVPPVAGGVGGPVMATGVYETGDLLEHQREAARRIVAEAEGRLLGRGIEIRTTVGVGRPADVLATTAAEVGAALIVVGSRGHRLLAAALLGSTSSTLPRLTTRPVLVVPPGTAVRLDAAGAARDTA